MSLETPSSKAHRRQRLSADQVRAVMLTQGAESVRTHRSILELVTPNYEGLVQQSGVSRSTAYRVWPYREDYRTALLSHLIDDDGYGTVRFQQKVSVAQEFFRDTDMPRDKVLSWMGRTLLGATDYQLINMVELTVSSLHTEHEDDIAVQTKLAAAKQSHVETIGKMYEEAHHCFDETVPTPAAYGIALHSLVSGFALNNQPAVDENVLNGLLVNLADQFSVPSFN